MRNPRSAPDHAVPLRVVYFGTPAFAVPALQRLVGSADFDVCLVVTQPDRPAGRGRRLTPSPVNVAAEQLGLPVYQPETLRTPDLRRPLIAAAADLFVVAAFGIIFGPKTLSLPRVACVNLHASLLPRYRGASPVSAAILSGDQSTGVSLMAMEHGLDTGPVIATRRIEIDGDDTTESLTERLERVAADLVASDLHPFATGNRVPTPQPSRDASLTRPLLKADGWVDWSRPAASIERHIRAMWPWPRAWTTVAGTPMQIHASELTDGENQRSGTQKPGTIRREGSNLTIACGDGRLTLKTVQLAGGTPIDGDAFLRRHPNAENTMLGSEPGPDDLTAPLIIPV